MTEKKSEVIKELNNKKIFLTHLDALEVSDFIIQRESKLKSELAEMKSNWGRAIVKLDRVEKVLERIGKRTGSMNKEENPETGNEYYWQDVKEALLILKQE